MLWGLPWVSAKEAAQVLLGNQLLRTTLEFLGVAWRLGVPGIMEHPATCTHRPEVPSSWNLPVLRSFAQMEGVDKITVHQCEFGARAVKPTTLLCVHVPALRRIVSWMPSRGLCSHGPGAHPPLIGRSREGGWRTAIAKTYPPPLCRLIAESIHEEIAMRFDEVSGVWDGDELELPDTVQPYWMPLDPYVVQRLGADCALRNTERDG